MEKQKLHADPLRAVQAHWQRVHTVRLVLCFLLNVLVLIGVVAYGGFYVSGQMDRMSDRIDQLTRDNMEMKYQIERLKKLSQGTAQTTSGIQQRQRREVLSSSSSGSTLDPNSLIRGPPGPPGPPGEDGKDGKDGKDGRDDATLQILNDVVNKNVEQEWKKLSASLPVYSGSNYIRWGRKSCPPSSKLIYHGEMAGPDYNSAGGGTNYQCLPSDPEYNLKAPANQLYSFLRGVRYELYAANTNLFPSKVQGHRAPCAVCETEKRVNQIMIPAKTRCPTDDWTLDYKGFLMSSAETNGDGSLISHHHRGMYVCMDAHAESVTGKVMANYHGERLYPVAARCSGDGALTNCPPYLTNRRALSCVVCSK